LRKSIVRRLKETQAQNLHQQHSIEDASAALQKTIDTLRNELWKCKTDANAERTRLLSESERRREDYQRDVDDGAKEKDALIARLNYEISQQKQEAQSLRAQNASSLLQLQEQLLRNDGLRQTLNYQVSASKRKFDAQSLSNRRQIEELQKQHRLDSDRQRTSYEARISTYEARLAIQPPATAPPSQPLPAPPTQISTSEFSAQIATLQSHLAAANTTISTLRTELSQSRETMLVLQRRVAQEKQQTLVLNQHNQAVTSQLNAAREEVAEVRSQLLSVEIERDLAETAHEDLEEQCSALEARLKDLASSAEGDRTGSRVQELVVKMGLVQAEKNLLEERVDELEEQIVGAEERINELERERDGIAQSYEERIQVSERANRIMAEQVKGARGLVKERDGLRTELVTCETLLQRHRSELETARSDVKSAHEEVGTLRKEIEVLKKDFEDVNQAMDKKVKEMMDQRDLEWIKRVEGLDRERKIMGRVLLREWGRGELGKMEPQAYRYKYALR
jgi:myosin protein heavy chain